MSPLPIHPHPSLCSTCINTYWRAQASQITTPDHCLQPLSASGVQSFLGNTYVQLLMCKVDQ